MTAQPDVIPPVIHVDVPLDAKKAEERLAHYHPEHHHFYEPTKMHTAKRLLRIVIAGTGLMADSLSSILVSPIEMGWQGTTAAFSTVGSGCVRVSLVTGWWRFFCLPRLSA